jgi:glycosyltransferase involved in cell wall biosynthesis
VSSRSRHDPNANARLLIDIGPSVGGHGQRGIGRYVRGLAAGIAKFPDDLAGRIWAFGFAGPELDSFGRQTVPIATRRGLGRAPIWLSGRLATDAALRASGAVVLHATDPQRPWTDPAVPSIVTVYDLIPIREPEMLRSWRLDHRLAYRSYLRQIESAARVIAISATTADDLRDRLGIPAERIDIVYPVVVAPEFIRRIEPAEPTFLFVGALDSHKQPELALRAFAIFHSRVGSGRLRLIGPAGDEQARALHSLARQLGVAASISIEGRISDEGLEDAFGGATALLATSRIEGFGLPPVEAIVRGVPVIAVETPAALETLRGAATIVPADAEAIAAAMVQPVEPLEIAVNLMRERYSIAGAARSLASLYRRVLG